MCVHCVCVVISVNQVLQLKPCDFNVTSYNISTTVNMPCGCVCVGGGGGLLISSAVYNSSPLHNRCVTINNPQI